jgi:epsin
MAGMLVRMVRNFYLGSRRASLTQFLVRVSAKELTALILDEDRLRSERSDRRNWKSRVTGIEEYARHHDEPRRPRPHRAQRTDEEDAEYRLAIEASKYQEEEDRKKRQGRGGEPVDEDLAKALKLSREEEELRRRELEEQNATSLFDDDPIQVAQPTGFNQGYQQQPAVDWSGNPVDQSLQQQPTGYMNSYNTGFQPQQTGFQPQQTGYPNGYPNGYSNGFDSQPTAGFDPYGAQQQQQFQQQQTLQPQQTYQPQQSFQQQQTGYNPYGAQSPGAYQQPEPVIPAGTNNPWATNNQQAQALKPTPTGSNNPFATSFQRPASTPAKPTLATLQEQKTMTNFNNNSSFNPITSFTPPKDPNSHEAKLNALLASGGDGLDTFGNTGNLRIPAQHTAPGTFVNSAGLGLGRIHEQHTGNNPFLNGQFTGMPQTTYGGTSGHQIPAATGPAGMSNGFGGGYGAQQSNNPFGAKPQQSQGQDLIQF